MFDTLHAYLFFGTSSSLLLFLMAVYVGSFRAHRSRHSFVILVLTLAVWSMTDVLELLGPSEIWCTYWYGTVRTSAICSVNVSWLYFCLNYAGLANGRWGQWLVRGSVAVFGSFAVASWTPWVSLLYERLEFRPHGWLWEPYHREVGNLFGIFVACSLISFVYGLVILCNYVYRSSPAGRKQVLSVLSAFGLLATISVMSAVNLLGNSFIDKTVFALPVAVMVLLAALFRQGFMQSDPILLAALMEHLPDRVLVLDEKGVLSEANPAGISWIEGFASERKRKSRSPAMYQRLVDYVEADSQLGRFLAELPLGSQQVHLKTAQQQEIYDVNVIALEEAANTEKLVTFRDETKLYHAVEDLQTYATTVAHDLKNPLTAIFACCDLLKNPTKRSPEEALQEFVPPIREAADSMNAIISDLLLIADLERKCEFELQPVNMLEITECVVRRLMQSRPSARISVETQQPWPFVSGHPTWLEMIMVNLLCNAVEHGNSVDSAVLVSCAGGDEVTFSITNQNVQSATENKPLDGTQGKVNRPEPETSLDDAGTVELEKPRGFGLSIVRRLVERQGGTFGMESEENEMRVWFRLHRETSR